MNSHMSAFGKKLASFACHQDIPLATRSPLSGRLLSLGAYVLIASGDIHRRHVLVSERTDK